MFTPTEAPDQGAFPHLELGERREGGSSIISCTGELVVRTAPAVRHAIADAVAAHPPRLVVDLSAVTRLDAAGLVAVTTPAMAGRRLAIDIEIVPPADPTSRRLADLIGVLPLVSTAR